MKEYYAVAGLFLLSVSGRCLANDTTAELPTGGLIFTKSNDIEMLSEDLFVSMKEIRVRYRFYNHTGRDVVTRVAFSRRTPSTQFVG
jgi:Domain of unknown function (DUF4424)